MKYRNLTYLGGVAALAVAAVMLSHHADVDMTTDALAENDVSSMTITCNGGTAPTVAAAVPDISTALTTTFAQTAAASTSGVATIGSGTGINAESGTITAITVDMTQSSGREMRFSHNAPMMKLYGLQCHNEKATSLSASGTDAGTAPMANYDVYADDAADDFSTSTKKIDGTTVIALFGSGGIIEVNNVTDGTGTLTDGSATANGEILIGSLSSTDTTGDHLWRMNHKIKFLDASQDYGSASETVTFTFTPVD